MMSNDMLDWLYRRALMRRNASLSVCSINSMSILNMTQCSLEYVLQPVSKSKCARLQLSIEKAFLGASVIQDSVISTPCFLLSAVIWYHRLHCHPNPSLWSKTWLIFSLLAQSNVTMFPYPKSIWEWDITIISPVFQPFCFRLKNSNHSTGRLMGALTSTCRDSIHISLMAVAPHGGPAFLVRRIDIKRYNLLIRQRDVLISSRFGLRSNVPARIRGFPSPFSSPALCQKGIKCSLKAPGGDHIWNC